LLIEKKKTKAKLYSESATDKLKFSSLGVEGYLETLIYDIVFSLKKVRVPNCVAWCLIGLHFPWQMISRGSVKLSLKL